MKFYKNKKIIFRLDAGKKDGFGHLKRSVPLINFLLRKSFSIVICTNNSTKNFLSKNLQKKVFLKKNNETEEIFFHRIKNKFRGYIIIIDKIYSYKKQTIIDIKKENEVIFIQNFSSGARFSNKLIVPDDHNKSKKVEKNVFRGSKYLVIRNEIKKIKSIKESNFLGVTFGGSDPYNLTIKILEILQKINWKKKTIFFYGEGYLNKKDLIKKVSKVKNFDTCKFNFKKLLKSRLILSAFGVTSYEIAMFNVNNLVILLNKKIILPQIHTFSSTNLLGYYKNMNIKKIENSLLKNWNINNRNKKFIIRNNAENEIFKIIKD